MKGRDIVIGLLIVLVVVFGGRFLLRGRGGAPMITEEPASIVEERLEDTLGVSIPDDLEKAVLMGAEGSGIATREIVEGKFLHSVLADLPDPESGKFYEGWLGRNGEYVPMGKLFSGKGGFILSYSSNVDMSDYNGVVVSLETSLGDGPTEKILEGSF